MLVNIDYYVPISRSWHTTKDGVDVNVGIVLSCANVVHVVYDVQYNEIYYVACVV